ncbi:MAG: anti-sigma factor antagonist [Clostridia bacterium]|nr:anti-sigma factor antagonist [Clostridia bacterium]
MNVRFERENKELVFEMTEEIDHHQAEELRRSLDYEIQRYMPRKVVFDFDKVTFMDSAGIGLVLGRYKMMKMLRWINRNAKCDRFIKKGF